jgi:hypothetical protein
MATDRMEMETCPASAWIVRGASPAIGSRAERVAELVHLPFVTGSPARFSARLMAPRTQLMCREVRLPSCLPRPRKRFVHALRGSLSTAVDEAVYHVGMARIRCRRRLLNAAARSRSPLSMARHAAT